MESYTTRKSEYQQELILIKNRFNAISFFRLISIILFLFSMFYYIKTQKNGFAIFALIMLVVFFVLMRFHNKLSEQKRLKETLIIINENEISYLKKETIPFENGLEFNNFSHPYAYDLDIFGDHSLFQNLNRTNTYIGKKTLAKKLQMLLPNNEILSNHQAVKELSGKLDWRQSFMAFAKMSNDNPTFYTNLLQWSKFNSTPLSRTNVLFSFVLPSLFFGVLLAYFITSNVAFLTYLTYLFIINLVFSAKFLKRINLEIANSSAIDKIINQYSLIVQTIEKETFISEKLIELQLQLHSKNQLASTNLKKLSELFSRMDSIGNIFSTILFNGTFLFHLHNLKALIKWKNENKVALEQWLNVIGAFEVLNSLANFSYNNPDYIFPTLNDNFEVSFSDMSHPLLDRNSRIGNDVRFQPQSFMILTGSNMSGKSTFLRSLGVNMVLAGIGASVCAKAANVHPLKVLVTMRLSDSLMDSESYFYAEIKRLKLIMEHLASERSFVLLDEILRGTNSDDKRNGTIEVIKKMIAKNAIGAIATHDIEVCQTTSSFPNQLINKCFEVEIINDDLHFDYQLRDGICKNKSATFLMKKMGVI